MAEDLIALLDYIGWKEPRGIHIIGLSLGGMIAQGATAYGSYLHPSLTETLKRWPIEFQNGLHP